jgi:two-component sensor histidine kinase
VHASKTNKIEELKQEFISCQGDSCRSTNALLIGTAYLSLDLDSTHHYCSIAQTYNGGSVNRAFQINIIKGIAYLRNRDFSEVDSLYQMMEPEAHNVVNQLQTAFYGNASNYYYRMNDNETALKYSLKSIELLDSTDVHYRYTLYGNISNIYARMNNYEKAISVLNDLHHFIIRTDMDDQEKENLLADVEYIKVLKYNKVGDMNGIGERYRSVLNYDVTDTTMLVRHLNGYSNYCLKRDSLSELKKTLDKLDGMVHKMRKESILAYKDLKIDYLNKTGNYTEAHNLNEKLNDYLIENSFTHNMYAYSINKAQILENQNKIGLANAAYSESLELIKQSKYKSDEVYLATLKSYLNTSRLTNADISDRLNEYTFLKDSLHELAFTNRVAYMDGKFESDKLKNENTVLTLSNEIKESRIESQKTRFFGLSIGLMIVSLLSYLLFRKYKKERNLSMELAKKSEELLLLNREMKHRSRGYLNSAINMLSEQRRNSNTIDLESALYKTEQRIRALSSVSAALDNSSELKTKFENLISDIIQDLTYKYDKEIKTTINIDSLNLDNHQVISIALITNELVFNSLKYAFGNTEDPKVELSIQSTDKTVQYNYTDNGAGLDGTIKGTGEGRRLIHDFVSQVHGKFEETSKNGYRFNMAFSKKIKYA